MREKKEINIKVGNEIRIAREKAGLTQEQFGDEYVKGCLFQAILFYLEIRQQMMLSIFLKDWNGYHLKNLLLF